MAEIVFWKLLIWISFILAAVIFIVLFFFSAPYGRHSRKGWGLPIANNLGWLIMESPCVMLFAFFFIIGSVPKNLVLVIFLIMFEAHYIHRALIYPFSISDPHKKMPVLIMLMGFIFNLFNAYINSRYLFTLSNGYSIDWLFDARFLIGLTLFVTGFVINRWADHKLRLLRKPGEHDYKIPEGGLYNLVSNPNYFGEILEWTGWALATWSLAGLSFAVWTFANLAPRARSNHAWYHTRFENYPQKRKAWLPGIW